MSLLHHIGLSGGKDSTALLLWAIHESEISRESLRVTFCDTGNENAMTYEHLRFLNETVIKPAGIIGGLVTLIPEFDFFSLALHKKRFPARVAQFCTIELKIKPTKEWLAQMWALGHETVILNGKRVGESAERKAKMKDQPIRGFSDYWGCEEWMPLREWSLISLLRNAGMPWRNRLLWAVLHVAWLVGGNALLDLRAWVKSGHAFPDLYDDAMPASPEKPKS